AEARFYKQSVRRIACNWKLIQDAFLDGYHVVRLHKNTVGPFFPDCVVATEEVGTHIRSAVGRNEVFDAVNLPPEEWRLREHATFSYTIFPNSIFIMHPDYTSHITLYPQGPGETIFVHSMLVPEYPTDEKGRSHYDRSFELIDGGVFEAEDIFVSVGAQAGMDSGTNTNLLVGAHEVGLQQFHEILRRELGEN
ncbi:MAG: SRPBCC family protein, partial [Pseudomonadales bacterium]